MIPKKVPESPILLESIVWSKQQHSKHAIWNNSRSYKVAASSYALQSFAHYHHIVSVAERHSSRSIHRSITCTLSRNKYSPLAETLLQLLLWAVCATSLFTSEAKPDSELQATLKITTCVYYYKSTTIIQLHNDIFKKKKKKEFQCPQWV